VRDDQRPTEGDSRLRGAQASCGSGGGNSPFTVCLFIQGGPESTGLILRVGNFATVRGGKACLICHSKVSEFCLGKKCKLRMSVKSNILCV